MSEHKTSSPALRHLVLFGFRSGVDTAQRDEIVRRFAILREEVPGIEAFERGVNCSPEGLNNGLTHCFNLTFASEAARDVYLHHSNHVAFAEWVRPFVESVTVIDYWAEPIA